MQGELKGKTLRFVNGGSGLVKAAYHFNCGATDDGTHTNHLHVYLGLGTSTEFVCSDKSLSLEERIDADAFYLELKAEREQRAENLRQMLLGPEGGVLIAGRQNGNDDKQTASSDIVLTCPPLSFT